MLFDEAHCGSPAFDRTTMAELTLNRLTTSAVRYPKGSSGALLLGLVAFVLLWTFSIPFRRVYVPNANDIPALADGSLLAPNAHWTDWFTRGYSNFWDVYPE